MRLQFMASTIDNRGHLLKRRKTWKLREHHLAHLKPVFGGMRAKAITTPKLQAYVAKRLEEGAAPRHCK